MKEPHTSGIYSRSRESLHDISMSERMHNSTYSHDFTLNSSKAFITQDDSVIDDEIDTTRGGTRNGLEGSLMSIVTESCNSSFFRDMNDSLYSPERDLRRAALRKSPTRKREKIRKSREDLSLCYDLDTSLNNTASQISSKPLSHYYPSSKSLVEKTFGDLNYTQSLENDKLARLWSSYRRGNSYNREMEGKDKDFDCLSQLICNPVQYFTQQWIEGVHKKNVSMSMTFESESDSMAPGKLGNGLSRHASWKSKRATDVQPSARVVFNEPISKSKNANEHNQPVGGTKELTSRRQNVDRVKLKPEVAEVEVEEAKSRTVSVQTPKELLFGLTKDYFESHFGETHMNIQNIEDRIPLSKMPTMSQQDMNQDRK